MLVCSEPHSKFGQKQTVFSPENPFFDMKILSFFFKKSKIWLSFNKQKMETF